MKERKRKLLNNYRVKSPKYPIDDVHFRRKIDMEIEMNEGGIKNKG
jgi:hypothetical protein